MLRGSSEAEETLTQLSSCSQLYTVFWPSLAQWLYLRLTKVCHGPIKQTNYYIDTVIALQNYPYKLLCFQQISESNLLKRTMLILGHFIEISGI